MSEPYPADFNDWSQERQNQYFADQTKAYRERQEARSNHGSHLRSKLNANRLAEAWKWQAPKALPTELMPVAPFDAAFLPDQIAPWVLDIAERMQCPPDFVAITAMVALGSTIGRKVAIRPQMRTDWLEVPNLWGLIVGRPGAMKSPAMSEALKPVHRLEAKAASENELAARDHARCLEVFKIQKDDAQKQVRKSIGEGKSGLDALLALVEPERPPERRHVVNDATYEKLGEILADNPNGVLAFRDELVSLLKTLDREDHAAARGFFLTAWNGTSGYQFDRIMRGKTRIEAACVSLLGSTQPGRLSEYIRRAQGAGDDGLIQRFGMLIWPDQTADWRNIDRYPDSESRQAAWATFERLDQFAPDDVGALSDQFDSLPFLRFDPQAQEIFNEWRVDHEARLRAGDLSPSLESHLAKYRKLLPSLALINHLVDSREGPVGARALCRALAFVEYLETHARRAYGSGSQAEAQTAKAILSRIRKGDLADGFTARDVYRAQWSNLSDREAVLAGLELLVDLDWLALDKIATGGKPKDSYRINPRAKA